LHPQSSLKSQRKSQAGRHPLQQPPKRHKLHPRRPQHRHKLFPQSKLPSPLKLLSSRLSSTRPILFPPPRLPPHPLIPSSKQQQSLPNPFQTYIQLPPPTTHTSILLLSNTSPPTILRPRPTFNLHPPPITTPTALIILTWRPRMAFLRFTRRERGQTRIPRLCRHNSLVYPDLYYTNCRGHRVRGHGSAKAPEARSSIIMRGSLVILYGSSSGSFLIRALLMGYLCAGG
jgi:hypothetical protein